MIVCACCHRPAHDPDADAVALAIGAAPLQRRLLEAVWRGKGEPVSTAAIITAMYSDGDLPDDPATCFKVTLHYLRRKLRGTGYGIESAIYSMGYRLSRTA